MSPRLVPALVAVVAAVVVWLGFALWEAASRRRRRALAVAFRRCAADRRLAVVSAARPSATSDPGPALVHGEVLGVDVDLCVDRAAVRAETRVEGRLPGADPGFVMVIARRDGRRVSRRGLVETRTGNRAFDAAFALLSNEPDLARSLLDRRLAQVVIGFPRRFVRLCAEGRRFALAWRGMETDAKVLDAAIEVVVTACRRRA